MSFILRMFVAAIADAKIVYRLLEHAIDHSRASRCLDRKVASSVSSIYCNNPSPREVLDLVGSMYENLHSRFKQVFPVKYQAHEDRFSFQSANIRVTMQVRRLVSFERNLLVLISVVGARRSRWWC